MLAAAGCGGSSKSSDGGRDGGGVAALTISPTTLDFGGIEVGKMSMNLPVVVRNTGASPSGAPVVTATGEFAVAMNGCSGAIMGGQMCTIQVAFRPTSAGAKSGTLSVNATPGTTSPLSVALSGTGQTPGDLRIDPARHDFGNVVVGGMATTTLTVTNPGGVALAMPAVAVGDTMNFSTTTTCMGMIGAMGTCAIEVTFKPMTGGSKTSQVTVNAGGKMAVAALVGNGQTPARLAISPMTQDFNATLGMRSEVVRFTVANVGDAPTGQLSAALSGANMGDFKILSNGCVAPLDGRGSCVVEVAFEPGGMMGGMRTATLTVSSGMVNATAMLRGNAIVPGSLRVDKPMVAFQEVAVGSESAPSVVTVTNTGGTASGPIMVTLASAEFVKGTDTCSNVRLMPMGTCTISVTFKPAGAGQKSASLIVSGDPGGQAASTLSGTGTLPPLLIIAPAMQGYGTIPQNTKSDARAFTVTNGGAAATGAVSITLGGDHPGEFEIAGNDCSAALAPGAMCTVNVRFSPKLVQGSRAKLLASATPGGMASADLSGTGSMPTTLRVFPSANVNAGNFDFGAVVVNQMTDPPASFTVQNTGTSNSGTITMSLTGPDGGDFAIGTNGCTADLAPGASCVVTVRFAPKKAGNPLTAILNAASANGANGSLPLTGRGLNGVEIFPLVQGETGPFDLGKASVGTTGATKKKFYVFVRGNLGTITAAVTAGAPSFTVADGTTEGGAFVDPVYCHNLAAYTSSAVGLPQYVVDNTLATNAQVLATAGGEFSTNLSVEVCDFEVTFTPIGDRGAKTGTITVSTTMGQSATVDVKGEAVGPLVIEPAAYAFSDTASGDSKEASFILKNNGGANLTVKSVALSGADVGQFSISADPCTNNAIAAPGMCTVKVRFSPNSTGAKAVTLTVVGTPVGTTLDETQTAAITGTASGAPQVAISPTGKAFPDTAINNESASETFTISNSGMTATGAITPVVFGPDFTIAGNNCVAALPAGGSCTVTVKFKPLAGVIGARSGILRILTTPGGAVVANLSGNALSRLRTTQNVDNGADLSSLDFGTVSAGQDSAGLYVRIYNRGMQTLTGGVTLAIEAAGDYPPGTPTNSFGEYQNQGCSMDIAAGAYCTYAVRVKSTAVAGLNTARLVISNGTDRAVVALQAFVGGGPGPVLAIDNLPAAVTTVNLGHTILNDPAEFFTVAVKNTGDQAGTITVQWNGTDSASGQNTPPAKLEKGAGGTECTTGLSLAAGASCNIVVRHKNDQTGTRAETLKVYISGNANLSTPTITFSGEVMAAGDANRGLVIDPTIWTFAARDIDTAPLTDTKIVTVRNKSAGNITTELAIGGTNAADFTVDANGSGAGECDFDVDAGGADTGAAIAGGASCTFTITFDPSATGAREATLTFNDGAGTKDPIMQVFGSGTDQVALTITGPNEGLSFGRVVMGQSKGLPFKVKNTGTSTSGAVVGVLGGAAANLYMVSGCGAALGPGAECTLTVTFAPTTAAGTGAKAATVRAQADAILSNLLNITGTAVEDASINVTANSSVTWTAQPVYKQTAATAVTLRNGAGGDTLAVRRRSGALTLTLSDTTNFRVEPGTCSEEMIQGLDPGNGAACDVNVFFIPQTQDGTFNATLTISGTPGGSVNVPLTGTSVAGIQTEQPAGTKITTWAPTQAVDTETAAFVVTVQNISSVTSGTLSVSLDNANGQYRIEDDMCSGANLAAGPIGGNTDICTITLRFKPTSTGTKMGSLTVKGVAGFSSTLTLAGVGS